MNNIHNPYIIGRPITEPDKFFGREKLFKFINDNLNNNQKIILLFGQRRIGKSSVLAQVSQQISKLVQQKQYSFVIFDLQDQGNLPLGNVLYNLGNKIITSLELSEIKLPSITEFEQNPYKTFFNDLLPIIYQKLDNSSLVLLLDEFDVFENGGEFLKSIRTRETNELFCIPVLGRSLDSKSKLINYVKEASSFEIRLLDETSATNLIIQPAQNILEYKPDAIRAILELSAGHPYFTQTICFAVFTQARANNKWIVEHSDIEYILSNAIEISEAGLAWFFNALPIPEQVLFSAVAELQEPEFENSDLTVIRLLEKYGLVKTDSLEKALEQLIDWRFLDKNKSSHKVKIEFVRRWLIKKYSLKELVYELEKFYPEANQYYENAIKEYEQKNIKKAIELYNQVLEINPNHFTALSNLGELYLDSQDFSKAIDCYKRYYKLDTDRYKDSLVTARLEYGEFCIQQENWELAKNEFDEVLTLDPQNKQAEQKLTELEKKLRDVGRNPYCLGTYVPAKEFIGREKEFELVRGQILASSHWAFYGSRVMGKTSFLKYLAEPETWQQKNETKWLGSNCFFVYLNCKSIYNFTFSGFWQEILTELQSNSNTDLIQAEINQVLQESAFNKNHVKLILKQIQNQSKFLVLLLDNYDGIFDKSNSNDYNEILKFLQEFRNLMEHEVGRCFSTIITSSKPLTEVAPKYMHYYLPDMCTAFKTFGDEEINILLSKMPKILKQEKIEDLRKNVQAVTGGYPALVQMLCFNLYNILEKKQKAQPFTTEEFKTLKSEFNGFAGKILRDIWESVNDIQKMLLMLIALYNLGGKIDNRKYDMSDVEDILTDSRYKSKIEDLKARGIILFNIVKSERSVKQQKEVYYFAASAMQEWVIREIASNDPEEVAQREKIFLIMSKGQVSKIKNLINYISENLETVKAIDGVIQTIRGILGI